jgi:hypothetical protein
MQIKDTTEISSIISLHSRSEIGYGYVDYFSEENLYFLLITRNKRGEELPQYFWDLEEPEMNWLESKGIELIPY